MAVVSVPKDLDRVNKSLEWFETVHGLFARMVWCCVITMRK